MKKLIASLVFCVCFFVLIGCDALPNPEKTVTAISVDTATIPTEVDIESVDISTIFLIITYSDGTTARVPLNESMIPETDRIKLTTVGTQTIQITYLGFETTFSLIITADDLQIQLMAIYTLSQTAGFTGTYEDWLASVRGPQGEPGKQVVLRVENQKIEWQYEDDTTWMLLLDLTLIADRKIIFRTTETHIEFQYVGETEWQPMVALSSLKGQDGLPGTNGQDGEPGKDGQDGEPGKDGQDGQNGTNGLSAYEIYKIYYPLYTGDEATWIKALSLGQLGIQISLNPNGGTYPANLQFTVLAGESFTLSTPTKGSADFVGWFIGDTPFTLEALYGSNSNQVMIHAKWANDNPVEQHKVTFFTQGGVYLVLDQIEHGSVIHAPNPPTLSGFEFKGWVLEGTTELVGFPYTVTTSLHFQAVFEADVSNLTNALYFVVVTQIGDELVVEAWLGGNVSMNAYDMRIKYDPQVLSVLSVVKGTASVSNHNNPGVILFNYSSVSTLKSESIMLTITFKLLTQTQTQLTFEVVDFYVLNDQYEAVIVDFNVLSYTVVQ
ncbi:MAG: InlB B-repeat-containing protein [Acholeplasma sp.]|nr:InlB B-repeat-containing protein [Acholeplasma sp.]